MRGETYIYYTGQYWAALFSEEENGKIVKVGKVIFGEEPSSAVFDSWLAKGSPGLNMLEVTHDTQSKVSGRKNPKRALREVRKLSRASTTKETKSQLAFNKTLESLKAQSKKDKKARVAEKKIQTFKLKKKKKKKKMKKKGK